MTSTVYEDLKANCEHAAEWYEKMAAGMRYCPMCCELLDADHCDECDEDTDDLYTYLADNVYDVRVTTDIHRETLYGCRLMIAGGGPNIFIDTNREAICGYWGMDEVVIPLSSRCVDAINSVIEEWIRY